MILNNFLLQQDAFRKLLHPEVEHLDPLSEIKAWEHVELRKLWFAYIRDRWNYPSNLYFTEAITYFLHGYCHGSMELHLEDNAATMVRLDTLWAEIRDSLPFINDDGTLLRAHREANQRAMDDVLTMLQAVHGMCEDPSIFNKYADNLGLIGNYRELPLIWKCYVGNHVYGPGSLDGSANSNETEILEERKDGNNGEDDEDDDDNGNDRGHGYYRPHSNRYGSKHHVASRRRSCDLYYDPPDNNNPPHPAAHQAEASHNYQPLNDGRHQDAHAGYTANWAGDNEDSRYHNSRNQPYYPVEAQRHPQENTSDNQHAENHSMNQAPPFTRTFYPLEPRHGFPNNNNNYNNYSGHNQVDYHLYHQDQPQCDYRRPPEYLDRVHTPRDTYQSHRQVDHFNPSHYQSNTQHTQLPNEMYGSLHREVHQNVIHRRENYQDDIRPNLDRSDYRSQGETRFDGPRPHNDLDQYHLGSDQRKNNHRSSSGMNRHSHFNSPQLYDRYGDRLRGSYGTGSGLPLMRFQQNQPNSSDPYTASTTRYADGSSNSRVYLTHRSPLAITAAAAAAVEPRPSDENSSGRDPPVTATAMIHSFQSQRFQPDQLDHPRFLTQTAGRFTYYPPVITARPQGLTTSTTSTTYLAAQDLGELTGVVCTGGPGLMPPIGDDHSQDGSDDQYYSNNGIVLEQNDSDGCDADVSNDEESEEAVDHDENEESTENDENDHRSSTDDHGGDSEDENDNDRGNGNSGGSDSGNGNGNENHGDIVSGSGMENNDGESGQSNGGDNTRDNNNTNEVNDGNNNNRFGSSSRQPQLSEKEKNAKDAIASIQPVMTEYGEYLTEKRKALEGPRASLEKRRAALRELKRVAQQVQDQFEERDALAKKAKSIDFQFRVCDDEMSRVLLDISMSNTYMSSALKRKRDQ